LAARLLTMFRICGFLCRFRADAGDLAEQIRDPLTSIAHHEIMISDEC
jgi:hypothetical protein